jgi:hypothetical protein
MTRRVVIALVLAGLLILGGGAVAGALLFGGNDSSSPVATAASDEPSPTASPTAEPEETPTSATPSPIIPTYTQPGTMPTRKSTPPPMPSVDREVFSWLTSPIPAQWAGQGGDGDNHTYADTTSCTTAPKNCPQVRFFSLTSGPNRVNYGPDPIRQWAKDVCPSRSPDSAAAQDTFTVSGVTITGYKLNCMGIGNFAWLAPGKLLVFTADVGDQMAVPATVKSVLERSRISA